MSKRLHDPRWRVTLLSLGAFCLYGGYALVANLLFGDPDAALLAGVGQGLSSAATTVIIGGLSEALLARLGRSWLGLLGTWLIPPTLTAALHAGVQVVLGTPDILLTIGLSVLAGYVFAGLYVASVRRLSAEEGADR